LRRALTVITQESVNFLESVVPYPVISALVEKIGVLCGDTLELLHPVGDQLALSQSDELVVQPLS
jgi:hypothetical protein